MRRAALAEAEAHIEYLERDGLLIIRRDSEHVPWRLLVAPGDQRDAAR